MRPTMIILALFCLVFPSLAFSQARLVEKGARKGNELVIPYEKYLDINKMNIPPRWR